MVKQFLRSDDPNARKITITKLQPPLKTTTTSSVPEKPARGRPFRRTGSGSNRPRPHSMSALPSASEADFTQLLTGLMNDSNGGISADSPGCNGEPFMGNTIGASPLEKDKLTFGPDASNAR